MRFLFFAVTLVAALVSSTSARADSSEGETRKEWYGWQTLTADASAITGGVLLSNTKLDETAVVIGYGGWVLGAPIVHVAHRRYGAALLSFGLRAALPVAGAYTGCALDGPNKPSDRDPFPCLAGTGLGVLIGATIAMAIDSSVLAYEKPKPKAFEVMPAASIGKGSGFVGLTGVF